MIIPPLPPPYVLGSSSIWTCPIFSTVPACRNNNKYLKFKIRHVQIDQLPNNKQTNKKKHIHIYRWLTIAHMGWGFIRWVRTEGVSIDFFKKAVCHIVYDHSRSIRQHVDWKRSHIQVRVRVTDKTKQGAEPQSASSLVLTWWLESIHLWSFRF